jgi:acetyl esterase/lipase
MERAPYFNSSTCKFPNPTKINRRRECVKITSMRKDGLLIATALFAMPFVLWSEEPGRAQQTRPAQESKPAQQQAPAASPSPASTCRCQRLSPRERRVRNYKRQDLLLDIYEPTDAGAHPRPAVLLIHGGGWTSFDKSTMRNMGKFLARSGFVAFSVDYRLLQGTDNRWPAQLDDVQRAVRWVRANAAKYGVDPDHIGAFGHSAGRAIGGVAGHGRHAG